MGRTIPSYRIATEMERNKWKVFRERLNKKEKKTFNQMFDYCRLYNSAGSNACRPFLIHPILMSIIFEHYKQSNKIVNQVSATQKENECDVESCYLNLLHLKLSIMSQCILLFHLKLVGGRFLVRLHPSSFSHQSNYFIISLTRVLYQTYSSVSSGGPTYRLRFAAHQFILLLSPYISFWTILIMPKKAKQMSDAKFMGLISVIAGAFVTVVIVVMNYAFTNQDARSLFPIKYIMFFQTF